MTRIESVGLAAASIGSSRSMRDSPSGLAGGLGLGVGLVGVVLGCVGRVGRGTAKRDGRAVSRVSDMNILSKRDPRIPKGGAIRAGATGAWLGPHGRPIPHRSGRPRGMGFTPTWAPCQAVASHSKNSKIAARLNVFVAALPQPRRPH